MARCVCGDAGGGTICAGSARGEHGGDQRCDGRRSVGGFRAIEHGVCTERSGDRGRGDSEGERSRAAVFYGAEENCGGGAGRHFAGGVGSLHERFGEKVFGGGVLLRAGSAKGAGSTGGSDFEFVAGTQAEEWTDPELLRKDAMLQPIVARWEKSPAGEKEFAANAREFSLEFDDFELLPSDPAAAPVSFSDFNDGGAKTPLGGNWVYSWQDAPDSRFELVAPGRDGKGYAAKISGRLDGASDAYWRTTFKADGTPFDASAYAGVRFWVRGHGKYIFRTLEPNISDWDDYSAKMMDATPEWQEVTIWFKDLKQAGWGVVEELTLKELSGFSISCLTDLGDTNRPPAGLYEGMITPLLNYKIRGAIWYQGEGNTYRAFQYRTLLPAMIRGWRAGWKEGDFPFLIVQLPNQGHSAEFADSWWAELREAQLLTAQSMPNVGLAVTIDVGDPNNLHPPRKEEVGARLALWALGTTYGKNIEFSGPLYAGMKVEGSGVRIRFENTGGGLKAQGEALRGFSIAGADKQFHRATARIDGNTVIVSSAEVSAPVAVRYDWADSPEGNLYNDAGLPASPFRTDDWPGATIGNR